MKRTLKGYINYGCKNMEKRPLYTALGPHPTAVVSEPIEYTLAEGWELGETKAGGIIVTAPWGWDYTPNDLLEGKEAPYFAGINGEGKGFRIPLEWRKI